MRIRNTSSVSELEQTAYNWTATSFNYDANCNLTNTDDSSGSYSWSFIRSMYTKEIRDVVIPRFHSRRAKGEIFNNPCRIITRKSETTPFYMAGVGENYSDCGITTRIQESGEKSMYYYGDPHLESSYLEKLDGSPPDVDISRLKAIAVTNAFSKIELSEAQLLATLAELRESVGTLVSVFTKVVSILKAVKKKDLLALRGEISPSALADSYMEYRYGLRPMVFDATDILKAMQVIIEGFIPRRQTFRARVSDTSSASDSSYYSTPGGAGKCYFHTSVRQDVEVSAGVLTDLEELSALNLWGCDQVVETAWELIPFSFIVDWFFNVGKTLASWTPEIGVKELASWVSVKNVRTYSMNVGSFTNEGSIYDYSSYTAGGHSSLIVSDYERTPNPNRSILPSWDVNLDFLKLLDLAIIMKQLMA